MDFRQVNKHEGKIKSARRKGGRFCPCCCTGKPKDEARLVRRARRRADHAIIAAELADR